METLKKTSKFIIIATFTALLAACGGNKSKNSNVDLLVCQTCTGMASPTLLATAQADSTRMTTWPAELRDVRFFGDASRFYYGTSSYNYNTYTGSIVAQGILRIKATIGDANWASGYNGGCVVPAGDYQLTSYAPGTISNGTNLEIQEMIAGPMRLRLTQAMLYREGEVVRIYGQLHITSVNGQSCSPFFTPIN